MHIVHVGSEGVGFESRAAGLRGGFCDVVAIGVDVDAGNGIGKGATCRAEEAAWKYPTSLPSPALYGEGETEG